MAGGAFWTRQKTEGLEGCLSDCFTCLGGEGEVEKWGQPKSSLLCVSVETTKATKRRSYPFCVSVSWETAGRSCILVLLFSPLRAINRWAHVALCSVTYTGLEPSNPGSSDSHMNRGRSRPPRIHFPQHMSVEKKLMLCVCVVVIFIWALTSGCIPPTLSTLEARPPLKCLEEMLSIWWRKEEDIILWCVYMCLKIHQLLCFKALRQ